jgi:hypothetical protein
MLKEDLEKFLAGMQSYQTASQSASFPFLIALIMMLTITRFLDFCNTYAFYCHSITIKLPNISRKVDHVEIVGLAFDLCIISSSVKLTVANFHSFKQIQAAIDFCTEVVTAYVQNVVYSEEVFMVVL